MKKAIIYARSATRMQFDESKPIQYQLKKCKEYAKENGIEVIQEFKSMGLNINQQYSGLNRILSFASSNEIHTILVTGVDRIGRSVKCMDAVAKWCSRDNKNQLINVTTGKNVPALQLGIMGEFFKDYSEEQVSFDDFLDDLSSEEILELIGEAIYKARSRFGQELDIHVKSIIENI